MNKIQAEVLCGHQSLTVSKPLKYLWFPLYFCVLETQRMLEGNWWMIKILILKKFKHLAKKVCRLE